MRRKPGPKPKQRYQTSIQLSKLLRDRVCELADRLGISRAALYDDAIWQLASKYLPRRFVAQLRDQEEPPTDQP